MDNLTKKDIIFYGCVTLVLVTWAITGLFADLKQQETQRQVDIEAIKNGYIECVVPGNTSFRSRVLWKKNCKE